MAHSAVESTNVAVFRLLDLPRDLVIHILSPKTRYFQFDSCLAITPLCRALLPAYYGQKYYEVYLSDGEKLLRFIRLINGNSEISKFVKSVNLTTTTAGDSDYRSLLELLPCTVSLRFLVKEERYIFSENVLFPFSNLLKQLCLAFSPIYLSNGWNLHEQIARLSQFSNLETLQLHFGKLSFIPSSTHHSIPNRILPNLESLTLAFDPHHLPSLDRTFDLVSLVKLKHLRFISRRGICDYGQINYIYNILPQLKECLALEELLIELPVFGQDSTGLLELKHLTKVTIGAGAKVSYKTIKNLILNRNSDSRFTTLVLNDVTPGYKGVLGLEGIEKLLIKYPHYKEIANVALEIEDVMKNGYKLSKWTSMYSFSEAQSLIEVAKSKNIILEGDILEAAQVDESYERDWIILETNWKKRFIASRSNLTPEERALAERPAQVFSTNPDALAISRRESNISNA